MGKTTLVKSLKYAKKSSSISSLLLKKDASSVLSPASILFGASQTNAAISGPTQLSTDGIDMEDWTPITDGPPVSFNVFDFAGQVTYFLFPFSFGIYCHCRMYTMPPTSFSLVLDLFFLLSST